MHCLPNIRSLVQLYCLQVVDVDCPVMSVLVQLVQTSTVQVDCDHGLHWSVQNLHILAGMFSLDVLYLEGKTPSLMMNIQGSDGDILPETSKSSAFWDMGVNSNLLLSKCKRKRISLF